MCIKIRVRSILTLMLSVLALRSFASANPLPDAGDLKLVLTIEQQVIQSPFPARVTLHLHNSGKETLWLYRRAVAPNNPADSSRISFSESARPVEGSTLAIHLTSSDQSNAQGSGRVLDFVGLPKPRLVRLAPGGDYEEKTVLQLTPSSKDLNGEGKPVWGRYKLSATYAAQYSNADDLSRIVGVTIWQGTTESNALDVELQPPSTSSQGSISGTVANAKNSPTLGVMVSLSDSEERLLNQTTTDQDGKYSFKPLPPGTYWVTVRRPESTEDTVVFRHLEVTAGEPEGTMDIMMPEPETFEPAQVLHKPVLFRIVDAANTPLKNVALDITWSNGALLDSVKTRTGDDGTAAVELIPGRCYVSLKMAKCPEDDERVDVAPGLGIDGSKITYDCSKK